VLAHREELIFQARDKIRAVAGGEVGIEMAENRATPLDSVVVASVQSLCRRLDRFHPDEFGIVVVDEAHHAPANTYRAIIEHFSGASVLGVTATPDRGDGLAMGEVFESVAFVYEIRDAIDEGYLVPIRQKAVWVEGLDLSKVRTTAGDLNEGDLEKVLTEEENLHGVVTPTVELAGERPTLVFATTVAHAHKLAEVFNRHTDRGAIALDGSADRETRRRVIQGFMKGEFQFFLNCALFTEGFDAPLTSCVAVARPTKSRALYTQMVGRGTRLHPGKEDLLILDFEGNAGRHSLVTAMDILSGKEAPEVMELAKQKARNGQMTLDEALDEAREEIAAAKRRKVVAAARYKAQDVDPFQVLAAEPVRAWWANDAITENQAAFLERNGIDPKELTKGQASSLIAKIHQRRERGLCTFKQAKLLVKYGFEPDVSFEEAKRIIDAIAGNRWRVPAGLREEVL
jgi:superfamily II DNA or RNA helicase